MMIKTGKNDRATTHRWRHAVLFVLIAAAYYVFFQVSYNLIASGRWFDYTDMQDFATSVPLNFLLIFLIFLLNYLIVFKSPVTTSVNLKVLRDVVSSFCLLAVVNVLFYFLVIPKIDWAGTIFNNVLILLGMEMTYHLERMKQSMRNEAEANKRKAKAQQQLMQQKYDVLKAQVSPHFLFNSLNILYSLTYIDIEKSRTFIMALVDIYRYILSVSDKERATLDEELRFLNAYQQILQMRFGDALVLNVIRDDRHSHALVPLTMQVLLENVTKHNVIADSSKMTVDVHIMPDGLTCSNAIHRKVPRHSSNIGLTYLRELYARQGKKVRVTDDGKLFTVFIPFI